MLKKGFENIGFGGNFTQKAIHGQVEVMEMLN